MDPQIDYIDETMEEGGDSSSPPPQAYPSADSPVAFNHGTPGGGSSSQATHAAKKTVQRGARACTVCRAAKMRCTGGDDQQSHLKPCDRCRKSNSECVFEKHRRGRKPGSKITTEASKARRLDRLLDGRIGTTKGGANPSPIQIVKREKDGRRAVIVGGGAGAGEDSGSSASTSTSTHIPHRQLPPHLSQSYPHPPQTLFPKVEEEVGPSGFGGGDESEDEEDDEMDMDNALTGHHPPQSPVGYAHARRDTVGSGSGSVGQYSQGSPQNQTTPANTTPLGSSTIMNNLPPPHRPFPGPYAPPILEAHHQQQYPYHQQPHQHQHPQPQARNSYDDETTPRPAPSSLEHSHHPHSYTQYPVLRPVSSLSIPLPPPKSVPLDDNDDMRSDDNLYPQAMLQKERTRQSFLATVLLREGPSASSSSTTTTTTSPNGASNGNPTRKPPDMTNGNNSSGSGLAPGSARRRADEPRPKSESCENDERLRNSSSEMEAALPPEFKPDRTPLRDPIDLGIVSEEEAEALFIKFFEYLNPCVSLFNPHLHTVAYVRSKSKFLLTCMLMACCKFWKPEALKTLQIMCHAHQLRCMADQDKSVEVVQAFSCLTYWKELEDNRSWVFVGYACRIAIEIGLDKFTENPTPTESKLERQERRNRERTFLVLFVHDRSQSMQTGRAWMLPESRLIVESATWHVGSDLPLSDTIVASFVQLRRMSSEITDVFLLQRKGNRGYDMDFDLLLSMTNRRLNEWEDYWEKEMRSAHGTEFHVNFMKMFKLHVRMFINSLGLDHSPRHIPERKQKLNDTALAQCYTSAMDNLDIVCKLRDIERLTFGQDVVGVMAAYGALFLLRLLRRAGDSYMGILKSEDVHTRVLAAGEAFREANVRGTPRFLENLAAGFKHMEQAERRSESTTGSQSREGAQSATSSNASYEMEHSSHQSETMHQQDQYARPPDAPPGRPGLRVATNVTQQPVGRPPASSEGTLYATPQTSHPSMQMQIPQQQQQQQPLQQQRARQSSLHTSSTNQHFSSYSNGTASTNVNGVVHGQVYAPQPQQQVQQNGPLLYQPQPQHVHPPMVMGYQGNASDTQQYQQQPTQYGHDPTYYDGGGSVGPNDFTMYQDQFAVAMWAELGLSDAQQHLNPSLALEQPHLPSNPDQNHQMYGM